VSKHSRREALRARSRRRRLQTYIAWGAALGGGLLILGLLGWQAFRPAVGEAVPVLSSDHVAEGTDPGSYNSDPPTSGPHYPSEYDAGFYDEERAASLPPFHEGYLVHNLEHGYVIFWYNCQLLDEDGCTDLKNDIQGVMDDFGGVKLIAFPRQSLEVPVVMTTWGRILRIEQFNAREARTFVRANRNRAPEPNAP